MFRTDSPSVTGKLTYSTIFQLAAAAWPEFSAQIYIFFNILFWRSPTHRAYKMFFISTNLQLMPSANFLGRRGSLSCQEWLLFTSGKKNKLISRQWRARRIFSRSPSHRLLSFWSTPRSPCCLSVHVSWERYEIRECEKSTVPEEGLHPSPVVPTSLWIHQSVSTTSTWR